MTLGELIDSLQKLAEEHGKEVEVDINIKADPECLVGHDAYAHELVSSDAYPLLDTRNGKDSKWNLGLYFS